MSAHTPGPWTCHPTSNVMQGYSQPWGVAANDELVAGAFGDTRGGLPAAEANARLIAATPDLLEAGQAALHELDATIRCVTDESTRAEMQAVADALRTAIANAKGTPS